jgi:two-component system phosphate regulon response regulator PhoB
MSHPSPAGSPPPDGEDPVVLVPERSAVRLGKREVAVTPTQFQLLALLMAEPGRSFSRAELVERVIGARVTERTVDVHIKELRRKLGQLGAQIEAVRGCGYRYRAAA